MSHHKTMTTRASLIGQGFSAKVLLCAALFAAVFLTACKPAKPATWGVSYGAVNHTDKAIVWIGIDGQGTVLIAPAFGQGGGVCCVAIPQKWHEGITHTISWREESDYKYDKKGNIVYDNGVPVLIEKPIKTKTVTLPEYKHIGSFYMHFFPNDEVQIIVAEYGPGGSDHPIPYPIKPSSAQKDK
jgi:Protein of unknown function (DUF3304)